MHCSAYSDGELAGAFAGHESNGRGANEAFDELVRRHSAMVFRTCRRVTGSYQDAEDATQLVFAALAERAAALTSYRSLGGWLYSTAWHIARHVHRANSCRRRREADAYQRDIVDARGEVIGADDDSLRELYRALEMLASDYRDVIVLHHLEGLTVEQVASVLGCSAGTVASRLSRGRAMMRQRLRERDLAWSAAMVSWMLSAQWTTDDQAVAGVPMPHISQRVAAARMIAPVAAANLAPGAAIVTKAAVATAAGWTLGKCAVAACASFLAVGVASVTVSHFIEKPPPRRQVVIASASASASATQDSAGMNDDAPPLVSRSHPPAAVAVPEPTMLSPLLLGVYLLRRRRR